MSLSSELGLALAGVCKAGHAEVHENGKWLAGLSGPHYEVRSNGETTLLHLWSTHQSLVRRVIRLEEQSHGSVVIEVARFGHGRPARLEVVASDDGHDARRIGREQWCDRLRHLIADGFPDETVTSLVTSADLHQTLSGSYARGVMVAGAEAYAVLGAAPDEDQATFDGILTFGLIWLDRERQRASRKIVRGLRLFLPRGSSKVTAQRLTALAPSLNVELYEYEPIQWRLRRLSISDAGNLETWLAPRREIDAALAAPPQEVESIRKLDPDAIRVEVSAVTRDIAVRFRGLEIARWQQGVLWFGLSNRPTMLTPDNRPVLEGLVHQLAVKRHSLASDTMNRFYRAQPERWLETMIAADPARIDPRLDTKHIYSQVPAFASGTHGITDLLGVTRDGRLVVLELKAKEDIHLVVQAVDYWLRVRWHQQQDDFRRYGYFPGIELQSKPPLLFLVAPGLQFHPTNDILLRYLSPEIEVIRVGLSENWRHGLRVIFRH
jgi:hypothetical protein